MNPAADPEIAPSDLPAPSAWRRRFGPGVVVAEKYQVQRVVSETDVTLVIAATRRDLDQRVTLRVLLPELAARDSVAQRYLQEARRLASLRSDHSVRVVDVTHLVSGEPVVATESLEGDYLSNLQRDRGPVFSIARAAELVSQACDAVAEAHERGWVHGDLSPRCLFVANRSRGPAIMKVLGFGVSALRAEIEGIDGGLTPARVVSGEPLYLAPEQVNPSQRADMRSDVWSLGAVLYELLVGRPLFVADGLAQLVRLVVEGPIEAPSALRPGVPQVLDDVVLTCLRRDPSQRYANVSELLAALEEATNDQSLTSIVELPARLGAGERESETEIRPFVAEARPPPVGPIHLGRLPSPRASLDRSRAENEEATDVIPSFATSSDMSSPVLNFRPHPLAHDAPPAASSKLVWLVALLAVLVLLLAVLTVVAFSKR